MPSKFINAKKITSLLLSLSLLQQAFAITPAFKDSTIRPTEYRLTKEQFLNKYGTNDTSRALIRYYFEERNKAKYTTILAAIAGGAAGLGFDKIVMAMPSNNRPMPNGGNNTGGLFTGFLFGLVIIGAVVAVPVAAFHWIRFSRRRLLVRLQKCRSGWTLPRYILENRIFRKYL